MVAALGKKRGGAVAGRVREWLNLAKKKEGESGKKGPIRPPDAYRPFPVEALPEPIRTFVVQGAAAIGCDVAYLALPALSVAASLIGNSRVIRLKRNWYEPAVVWSGIVGDSGTLKSPAVGAAVNPLYRLQKKLIKQFRLDREQYQKDKEAYDERKRQAKKEEREFTGEPPEKPTLARVVTGDITVEKLAELLDDNCKGLLTCRDDLGGWLGSFTRYKGRAGGSDLPNWLEMSRAGTIQVDRKTGDRPTLFITHAAVSITGGIQPGALARALTPEYMEVGLGARILLAMPPKLGKRWSEVEIDLDVQEAYDKTLHALRELHMDRDQDGEKEPFAVRLTPEAKTVWVRFYGEWAKVQANAEGELAAAYSKPEGYAARLALIHHIVSLVGRGEDDCQPIEPASIEAGVTLARWFAYEVRRIYRTLAETEDQKHTRKLLELIRSWGGIASVRRLQHASGSRYRNAEDAEAALQALVDAGLAEWQEREPGPQGGRPTRVCILKPGTDKTETDKTHSDEDVDDDDGSDGVPTEPPDKTPPDGGNSLNCGGFVGFGFVGSQVQRSEDRPPTVTPGLDRAGIALQPQEGVLSDHVRQIANQAENVLDQPPGDATDTTKTDTTLPRESDPLLITDPSGLELVCLAVAGSPLTAVDCETTGLDPRKDRLRLLSVTVSNCDRGINTYLVDCFAVDPTPLWGPLAESTLVAHNAAFDLAFLAALGFVPGTINDTLLDSQLLYGLRQPKGFHGLAACAQRELDRELHKELQRSDWAGTLTADQLAYAAEDSTVLLPLRRVLADKLKAARLDQVAAVERRALSAIAWLARHGVGFDVEAWDRLAEEARRECADLAGMLDAAAPARDGYLAREGAWNWSSPADVLEAFRMLRIELETTGDDALAGVAHPLAALLRRYRTAGKRASTYGPNWYKGALVDGRVYSAWKQLGADSGRMACGRPNLQNLPGDERYRRCFRAPKGRVLVKADYGQVELRIAAKVSGDEAMLDAYRRGLDLHTLTARRVLGVEQVTKEDRKVAKALNFGLLYGMGVGGFRRYAKAQYGLDLDDETTKRYIDGFFAAYPGLKRWHRRVYNTNAAETRTLAGRRSLLTPRSNQADGTPAGTPHPQRLNLPVQGTGADGLKAALALLWERRAVCAGAFPVLVVHDEIVVECAAEQAETAAAWLQQAMTDGMAPLIDPVPIAVEVMIGQTWASS
jgi:DNA polymerase I-like protein with 3'-5' exonuclease and polymerase domains